MTHICFVTDEGVRDKDIPFLDSPLSSLGIFADQLSWRDTRVNWANFDLIVLKSPWTYPDHYKHFEQWLAKVQRVTRVHNPPGVIRWNMDKTYLMDYVNFGISIPKTFFCSSLDEVGVALDSLKGPERIVVKPTISNGAKMTGLFRRDDPAVFALCSQILRERKARVVVQEAIASAASFGESSFVFFGGELSHVVRKAPILREGGGLLGGDGPLQEVVTPHDPLSEFTDAAIYTMRITEDILSHRGIHPIEDALLYARLDFVMSEGGEPLLLEAELFEPSWFLECHPAGATRFTRALSPALSRSIR